VSKSVEQVRFITRVADARTEKQDGRKVAEPAATYASEMDTDALLAMLEAQMREAAKDLDFETAARLRDQIFEVKAKGAKGGDGARGRASTGTRR
jgi:excinuclease ABC subunit B